MTNTVKGIKPSHIKYLQRVISKGVYYEGGQVKSRGTYEDPPTSLPKGLVELTKGQVWVLTPLGFSLFTTSHWNPPRKTTTALPEGWVWKTVEWRSEPIVASSKPMGELPMTLWACVQDGNLVLNGPIPVEVILKLLQASNT